MLELTTNQKGVIAETAIVHRAAKLGYGVARPLDDERYDLILDLGSELGEIDAIAAYCAELDACYLLPLALSVGRAAVQLRLSPTRNNQRRRINWAKDYEFGATLTLSPGPIAQLGER